MTTRYVLDASALLAVLLTEPGANKVLRYMQGALLSCVNLAEVTTRAIDLGKPLEDTLRQINRLPLHIVSYDAEQAHITASLRPASKQFGLSLGDRACLALGVARQATIITGDREWKNLKTNIKIIVFR